VLARRLVSPLVGAILAQPLRRESRNMADEIEAHHDDGLVSHRKEL
jgi:hypothetical protein